MEKCYFDMGGCTALKEKKCKGCAFYTTYTDLELSRGKAFRRLRNLPVVTRLMIAEKYNVGGIMWEKLNLGGKAC